MKIAIPSIGDQVDQHFGHCEKYTVFTIEGQAITNEEHLPSPAGCGCKSNMAATLAGIGVKVLIAGDIGNGAVNVLAARGELIVETLPAKQHRNRTKQVGQRVQPPHLAGHLGHASVKIYNRCYRAYIQAIKEIFLL